MALEYLRDDRQLSLRGSILLADGTTYELEADNVVRYSIDESSTGGAAITIGDARAADYALEIEDTGHALTAAQLIGAKVTMDIALEGEYSPLGVWYVDSAQISRQSATVFIGGSDALASQMEGLYVDGAYPATLGDIARRAADQAGIVLTNAVFRNSDVVVSAQPDWDTETNTQREVIGYVAGCAGGFARITRFGALEIVPYNGQTAETVTADYFATLSVGSGRSFAFNCLQVAHFGTNIYTRYAIDASVEDTAANTLRISDNPLLTADIAQTLVATLTGLSGQALSVDWVGDPSVMPGSLIEIIDTDNTGYTGIVTNQSVTIDGGLRMHTTAELPENITSSFASDTLFTPSGRVNIQAIEGRLKVWAEKEISIAVGGKADQSDLEDVQAQLDLVPDQISLAVNNIHVGGTNLLLDSASGRTSSSYEIGSFYLSEVPADGETVTVRLWGSLGSDRSGIMVYNSGGIQHLGNLYWDVSAYSGTFVWQAYGDNDRITIWQTPSSGTSTSTIAKIKLERGNKATDWTPSPEDPTTAYEVIDGSQLVITKDEVHIDTPEFSVNVNGTSGDMSLSESGLAIDQVNSPSVMARYTGPTYLTVGGTADGVSAFASLSDAFAVLSNKFIPEPVEISFAASTVENRAELVNTMGATITVIGWDHTLSGRIYIANMANKAVFTRLNLATNGGGSVFSADVCASVEWHYGAISGDADNIGADIRASRLSMFTAQIDNCYMAVKAEAESNVYIQSCTGSGNTFAAGSYQASLFGMWGTRPSATNGLYCERGSWMSEDPGEADGSGTTTTPTVTTTVTLTASNSRTHDGGGWYSGTNVVAQGKTSDGGVYKGCIWFDLSGISSRTVQSARIRLYRRAGVGKGSPVVVLIGTMSNAGPSGGVATVTEYGDIIGTVDQKAWLEATIPTAAAQQLANGSATGLYTYGSLTNYAHFDGFGDSNPPQLIVTYT